PLVLEQVGGLHVVGDVNVWLAVVVQVQDHHPQAGRRGGGAGPGGGGDVGKRAVAVVAVQLVFYRREDGRRAVVALARGGVHARGVARAIDLAVIADVEV